VSRLAAPPKHAVAALLLALAALAMALLAPSAAVAGIPLGVSDPYSSHCESDGNGKIIDPVGVYFHGTRASAKKSAFETERLAGWTYEGLGDQRLRVKVSKGNYECRNVAKQPASEPDYRLNPPEIPQERFHVRLWFIPSSQNAEELKTVGTPHHEDFIEHDPTNISDHCKGLVSIPWGPLDIAPGSHAVDKGGKGTGLVSGFDQGRHALRNAFEKSRHTVIPEFWGNDELIEQCDEDDAGSDGNGLNIKLKTVKSGRTDRPQARQSSATLLGRLETDENSTEWWFEYGPNPSAGAGTYPNKTAVKSVAEAVEVDVNRGVKGLSPSSTYYVRMFVRDKEGLVEEGNEVKFETCGWENVDEDDNSDGPRVATPECSGEVDAFYRDVNGDLGHQSWTPGGEWTSETLPASAALSADPRMVPRSDGTGVVDVFYREADGDLGHQWRTPGSGWQVESRTASMASNPNVVTRPSGIVDVFYRTTGGLLGHQWLFPGLGWSSETRATTLSSDPHAIALKDGSLDVIFRTGTSLGRDHWTSAAGWTHEVRAGSLVGEPRPLAGENGLVDVFYRTNLNDLGRDRYVPGIGWTRETRAVAIAADPHAVKRPNGSIDVFYRTSANKLGHVYWLSASGWSTETRPGNISSDPHVVARSNGTVEVFYRDGNKLGHQWLVPGTGWSTEVRPGPVAWHTDPQVVTQSNGRIDVIYESPNGQLGRDAYVPGGGWSHELRPMKRPSRPVAAYSFDAGSGTLAKDLAASHNGTIEGAKWTTRGKFGSALTFNGAATEKVTIPDANDLDLTDELTLEAWVRPTEAIEWSAIISKLRGTGISYQLTAHADHNAPVGYLANSTKEWGVDGGTTPLPAKTWSHIAFTSDGGRIRFYVNGKLKGSDSMLVAAEPSTGPLVIGGETFKGRIDEVRVYDRALDEGELTADKATPVQTPARPPVAAYSFEAGEGELAEDVAGNHDGTLVGPAWFDNGKYGSALRFDGIDDLVTVPDANDLDLTDEFTLEAWVRPDEANKWSAVITKERGKGAVSYQMHAEGEKSAPVGYVANSSGTYGVTAGTTPIAPRVWSHLAMTYDGAKLRFYIDGVLKATATGADPGVSADQLLIGGNLSWPEDAFKGLIDEIRIYDRALDEGEINSDKATPIQTPARPAIASYSFDEGVGTRAEDFAADHDGTVEGAKWTTRGKFGNALTFNGAASEKVTIADANDLDFTDELTLEAWVRPTEAVEWSSIVTKKRGTGFSYQLSAHGNHNAPVGYLSSGEKNYGVDGGTTPLPAKTWSHIAFTSDGGRIRFYVNGKLKGSDSMLVAAEPSIGSLVIGGGPFKGRIDEVRVYNRALSEGEIATDKATPVQTPPRPPVATYSFDAGTGEVAEDSSGANDGTLVGPTWFANGKFGAALRFDGINDLVSVPDANALDLTDEFTLEAWVRPDEANPGSAVINKERGKGTVSYQMHAEGTGGVPVGHVENSAGRYTVTAGTTPITPRVWSHLAMTYDGAKLRYYVDGVLKGTASSGDPGISGDQLLIGGNLSWPEDAFKGLIDEIRIYDRALEEAEIIADKATPIQTPARFPVATYSFDAGAGTVAKDTARAHDGTIEGALWSRGKYGTGLLFDGKDDCVKVPHAADLQLSEDLTVEAWVQPQSLVDQPILYKNASSKLGYALAISSQSLNGTGKPEGLIGEGAGLFEDVVAPQAIEANVWSHLAFTYDGATMRLYVNGVLVASQAQTTSPPTGEGPLTIGCNSLLPRTFEGLIDEVRIYDRALDEGEIKADLGGNRS
jgi:hypothetical protein